MLRRLLNLDVCADLQEIAEGFREIVIEQRERIWQRDEQIRQMELEHARHVRSLLANFLVALDIPEDVGIRESLQAALEDMADQVARLEEHV